MPESLTPKGSSAGRESVTHRIFLGKRQEIFYIYLFYLRRHSEWLRSIHGRPTSASLRLTLPSHITKTMVPPRKVVLLC